ncbi:MAG: hypothetical protein L3K52_00595 [Candidatus Thiothrix sulfatifontis]|nr:MAG: hypothetical protein L3K52_00595 [Candidatus Thiothrix sulfatifontis]
MSGLVAADHINDSAADLEWHFRYANCRASHDAHGRTCHLYGTALQKSSYYQS